MKQFATFPTQRVSWWYAEQFDSEAWFGPHITREMAVEAATKSMFREGELDADVEGFWLVSGRLKLPAAPELGNEVINWLLNKMEDDECWFEDCGLDRSDALAKCDQPDGLRTFLAAATLDWMVRNIDLQASRMIDDFETMDFYRRVKGAQGDVAELEPDTVP